MTKEKLKIEIGTVTKQGISEIKLIQLLGIDLI